MSSRCARCAKPFVNGDKKSNYNNHEYHQDCFRCSTCFTPITTAFYNLGNEEYRCEICQKRMASVITCFSCSKTINEGSYIEYNGEAFHPSCFQCTSCSQSLGNMVYIEHESKPYCVTCHMDKFAQICAVCQRPFPPGTLTRQCDNQYFHIQCFRCFQCGKVLLGKNYIIDETKRHFCDECYSS